MSSTTRAGLAATVVDAPDSPPPTFMQKPLAPTSIIEPIPLVSRPGTEYHTKNEEKNHDCSGPPQDAEPYMNTRSSVRPNPSQRKETSASPGPNPPKFRFKGPTARINEACKECKKKRVKCCGSLPCQNCSTAHKPCSFGTQPSSRTTSRSNSSEPPPTPSTANPSPIKHQDAPNYHFVNELLEPKRPCNPPAVLTPGTSSATAGSSSQWPQSDNPDSKQSTPEDPMEKELERARMEVYQAGFQEEHCFKVKRKLETELARSRSRRDEEVRRRREQENKRYREEDEATERDVFEKWRASFLPVQKRQTEAVQKLTELRKKMAG